MKTFLIFVSILALFDHVNAADISKRDGREAIETGGAVLKSPLGSRRLEEQPIFFKWSVSKPEAVTTSLKIYLIHSEDSKELVDSFDFKSQIGSMSLSHLQLSEGQYEWVIHTFDENHPQPLSEDKARFFVKPSQVLNLKTHRLYGSFATGRGDYQSEDKNYSLSFDTTPTIFSGGYAGSSEAAIYEISYGYSDFTIQGELKNFQVLQGHYSFRVLGSSPYSFELFIGPQLRSLAFPLVSSTDGTSIQTDEKTVLNAGINVSMHQQMTEKIALFASMYFDDSVTSSSFLSNLSYEIRGGAFYNVLGPIGLGAELAYKSDEITQSLNAGPTTGRSHHILTTGKFFFSF